LPTGLRILQLSTTSVSYGSSGAFQSLIFNTITIRLDNCSLSETEVDAVLADLVAGSINAGNLNISSNTKPTVAGYADKATLIARGWAVTTD